MENLLRQRDELLGKLKKSPKLAKVSKMRKIRAA